MADAVNTQVLVNGAVNYIARFTNRSDGTGESAVIKVSKASLLNSTGQIPAKLNIRQIVWSIQGFTSVSILWDHTTDDIADILATGPGFRDYTSSSNLIDPASAGGTGDILFTTFGAVANATYDIWLWLLKSG